MDHLFNEQATSETRQLAAVMDAESLRETIQSIDHEFTHNVEGIVAQDMWFEGVARQSLIAELCFKLPSVSAT